ncbi:MAG: SCO1664 family protein [Anaerolineae bacterium]
MIDLIPAGADSPLSFERVVEVLEKGTFDVEHGAIRWSSNYTFLVSMKHEDVSVMAVYKPQRGERPLWDFPDGTLCFRERAAFLTAQALGWDLVPPTVLRHDAPSGLGSLQFFVEHDPNYHYFHFDATLEPQVKRLAVFDALVNNADRKGGHCLVDSRNHLWGIDHGITFHAANKLRTVIWNYADQPVADDLLCDVETLCSKLDDASGALRQEFGTLLHEAEILSFNRRIRRILKTRKYPSPGSNGPNYPWPPV